MRSARNGWMAWALSAAVGLGLVAQAQADVFELKDGSSLRGQFVALDGGVIDVETSYAGRVKLNVDEVQAFTVTGPVTVGLPDGERVTGPFNLVDGVATVDSDRMGPTQVSLADATAVWQADADDPATIALREELDELNRKLTEAEKSPWGFRFEAGLTGRTGNTERVEFRGAIEVSRNTDRDRLLLYLNGTYAESAGERSAAEAIGGAKLEVDLTERWFALGRIELEYDEFENIDLRASATAGLGYFWIRKPDHTFKTSVSLGYRHETFSNGTSDSDAIVEFGLNYRKKFAEWFLFRHDLRYIPVVDDWLDDYRLIADTAGEIPITQRNLFLRIGMKNEYDNSPAPGVERLDTTYYINLVIEFLPD